MQGCSATMGSPLARDLSRELEQRLRDVLFARLDTIDAARGRIARARATIGAWEKINLRDALALT